MDKKELLRKLEDYLNELSSLGESVCIERKKERYIELESIMTGENFWEDTSKVKEVTEEIKILKKFVN